VDGGGEGFKTKGNGGAWETTEGWRNFAERIDWIVLDDSHFNVVDFIFIFCSTFLFVIVLCYSFSLFLFEMFQFCVVKSKCYGGWHRGIILIHNFLIWSKCFFRMEIHNSAR
jgi:hypothetical protein